MKDLQYDINEIFIISDYLQLMSSFVPNSDFDTTQKIIFEIRDFIKKSNEIEVVLKLPTIQQKLSEMAKLYLLKFPLKKRMDEIALDWNEFFKNNYEIYSYGLEFGWLEERMNLEKFKLYDYVPYHFRIGLVAHKGNFGIEEEFLLKDAFNILVKSQNSYEKLIEYGEYKKTILKNENKTNFDIETIEKITDLKYEISANSRLTIISFYAFIECFVNSVGFSFAKRNQNKKSNEELEILNGKRKGRFLQLKSKIEKYQKIIREDGKVKIVTSDDNQIKEPFTSFFNIYEEIRNSSVHFSPNKEQIWIRPKDWLEKAEEFSKISIEVAKQFWKSCYPNIQNPDYLGRLDYDFFITKSKNYLLNMEKVNDELKLKKNCK